MYIKIIGDETHYNVTFAPFTTQHGKKAIRFFGEIPDNDKGFTLYNDDDTVALDMSEYHYLYRHNEYSNEYDEIEMPLGNNEPIPTNPIIARLNSMSAQISNITPYEQTKTAYCGEREKNFYGVPEGVLTLTFDNYDGQYEYSRVNDRVSVGFPRLESNTNITIMVQ